MKQNKNLHDDIMFIILILKLQLLHLQVGKLIIRHQKIQTNWNQFVFVCFDEVLAALIFSNVCKFIWAEIYSMPNFFCNH